jgi:hypothetical protein
VVVRALLCAYEKAKLVVPVLQPRHTARGRDALRCSPSGAIQVLALRLPVAFSSMRPPSAAQASSSPVLAMPRHAIAVEASLLLRV